jgi:hypothetical protein
MTNFSWNQQEVDLPTLSQEVWKSLPVYIQERIVDDIGCSQEDLKTFALVPIYRKHNIDWTCYLKNNRLASQYEVTIQGLLNKKQVKLVNLAPLLRAAENQKEVARSAGKFAATATLLLIPKGSRAEGEQWGLGWSVYVSQGMREFLRVLGFKLTTAGLSDDDDIMKLAELGFSIPCTDFIEGVRKDKVKHHVKLGKDVEKIKEEVLRHLAGWDKEFYVELSKEFDEGYATVENTMECAI